VSWVRLDVDTPIDERLFGSGFSLYWPAVLTRAKKGGGHISRLASSPKQLAALWGSTVEEWTSALRYFVEVGLIVVRPDGDGYDVDDWRRTQVDPTNAERQARHRNATRNGDRNGESNATVTETVTAPTVTRPLRPESETVTTYIQTDIQDTTGHSSSSIPPPPSRTPEEDEDLRSVVDAWLSTQLTPRGHVRVQATGHELEALRRTLSTHGRERTLASIRRAADTAETASPKLSLFLAIAERGVLEGPRPETPRREGKPETKTKRAELAADDDYWAEGREASRRLGGRRVTKVPGVGYIATEELTPEHIAAVEAAGFAVL